MVILKLNSADINNKTYNWSNVVIWGSLIDVHIDETTSLSATVIFKKKHLKGKNQVSELHKKTFEKLWLILINHMLLLFFNNVYVNNSLNMLLLFFNYLSKLNLHLTKFSLNFLATDQMFCSFKEKIKS